jgi:hypothetical protein
MLAEVLGNVIVVLSVPARVSVLFTVTVFPLATVNVPVVVVMMRPLMLVAVAAPSTGVTSVGDVASTTLPDPVVVAADIAVPLPCKMPVMLVVRVMAGVVVAVATVPANPLAETTETLVTVPVPLEPFEAAVMRPCWSTVIFAFVYDAGVTAVFASEIVPEDVIGPPVRPVPVSTSVTVPVPVPPTRRTLRPLLASSIRNILIKAFESSVTAPATPLSFPSGRNVSEIIVVLLD